jgi:hypothetical protein
VRDVVILGLAVVLVQQPTDWLSVIGRVKISSGARPWGGSAVRNRSHPGQPAVLNHHVNLSQSSAREGARQGRDRYPVALPGHRARARPPRHNEVGRDCSLCRRAADCGHRRAARGWRCCWGAARRAIRSCPLAGSCNCWAGHAGAAGMEPASTCIGSELIVEPHNLT